MVNQTPEYKIFFCFFWSIQGKKNSTRVTLHSMCPPVSKLCKPQGDSIFFGQRRASDLG